MAVCPVIPEIIHTTFVKSLKASENCIFLTTQPRCCNVNVVGSTDALMNLEDVEGICRDVI
jgi:hypothetical protein